MKFLAYKQVGIHIFRRAATGNKNQPFNQFPPPSLIHQIEEPPASFMFTRQETGGGRGRKSILYILLLQRRRHKLWSGFVSQTNELTLSQNRVIDAAKKLFVFFVLLLEQSISPNKQKSTECFFTDMNVIRISSHIFELFGISHLFACLTHTFSDRHRNVENEILEMGF